MSSLEYFSIIALIIGLCWVWSAIYEYRNPPKRIPKSEWKVQVGPAQRWCGDYMGSTLTIQDGQMAIRLVRGEETMIIATIKIHQVDFEDQLHKAVAQAEEKASTLNAVYAELNA
jgi:hypothetical protein